MDQPMLTANPELTIDEASVLIGLAHRGGHSDISAKLQNAIMKSVELLTGIKTIELNKPTITSTPTAAVPLSPLGALAIAAVDETAGIYGSSADSEGGEA